jgi:purine-binding chemotaxis protein CheW
MGSNTLLLDSVLLVTVGERQFGLPLDCVERVLPMASVLPLPDGGRSVLGMLNLHGQVLPVVDPRPSLGQPSPALTAEQRLVLLRSSSPFLLWVDCVDEVVTCAPDALSDVPAQHPAAGLVQRVLRRDEAIVAVLAPAALEPPLARR